MKWEKTKDQIKERISAYIFVIDTIEEGWSNKNLKKLLKEIVAEYEEMLNEAEE